MSDEHEFDFDSDMINMIYGMTNLDKEIAQKGGLPKMKKLNPCPIRLKFSPYSWETNIISNDSRSIQFRLHYRVESDSWYGSISDSDDETFLTHFDVPDDSAYFMINIEDYEGAKDSHKEFLKRRKKK